MKSRQLFSRVYRVVKQLLRAIRRMLRMAPMQRIVRELRKRGVEMETLDALEIFGGVGVILTRDYSNLVSTLEIWEYEAHNEAKLRQYFPNAEIKITDSFKEIKRTSKKYSMIVCDSPPYSSGGGNCEHFDLFPEILRIAKAEAVIILNVLSEVSGKRRGYPLYASEDHLVRRQAFYKTNTPEKIPLEDLVNAYEAHLNAGGFNMEFYFIRNLIFGYHFIFKIKRIESKMLS